GEAPHPIVQPVEQPSGWDLPHGFGRAMSGQRIAMAPAAPAAAPRRMAVPAADAFGGPGFLAGPEQSRGPAGLPAVMLTGEPARREAEARLAELAGTAVADRHAMLVRLRPWLDKLVADLRATGGHRAELEQLAADLAAADQTDLAAFWQRAVDVLTAFARPAR